MSKLTSLSIFLLRISLGWLFFYAGLGRVLNSAWSAEGALRMAKVWPQLFNFLLDPKVLPYFNFVNKWLLVAVGFSLLVGLFVRWSALAGMVLVLLDYLVVLNFPHAGEGFLVVNQSLINLLILFFLAAIDAGRLWGLDGRML